MVSHLKQQDEVSAGSVSGGRKGTNKPTQIDQILMR